MKLDRAESTEDLILGQLAEKLIRKGTEIYLWFIDL